MSVFLLYAVVTCEFRSIFSARIQIPECEPPDFPLWGGYGPRQDFYVAGDVIHYYCDTETYMSGHFYSRCDDTGDWIGNTPFCDPPSQFKSVNQTSAADPEDENGANLAIDGSRNTCFTTKDGTDNAWIGMLSERGSLYRVMVFPPKIEVAYDVLMIKQNGEEYSCGSRVQRIESLNWQFHDCPEDRQTDVVGIKIKSLSSAPLQLCEVVPLTLTFPTCPDPHLRIENGRLQLSRKTANLVCDTSYTKSPDSTIACVRTGLWSRKSLYCSEKQWETDIKRPVSEQEP